MSRLIPIAGVSNPVVDPYYRYKMPPIVVEPGKANATAISNLVKIASCLHRSQAEILKYFALELSVASSPTKSSLKGRHSAEDLQSLLARYIDTCVLCPSCGLPETKYSLVGDQVHHDCNACGGTSKAKMDHRMSKFILNSLRTQSKQMSKKERRKVRQEEKQRKEQQRMENEKTADGPVDPKEIAWDSDTDDATALEQTIKSFRRFLRKQWSPGGDVDIVVEELTNRQVSALLPSHDRIPILLRAVLRRKTQKGWKEDIQVLMPVLLRLLDGTSDRFFLERHVLAGLEVVCMDHPKFFPVLVLMLYEGDVLSEDSVLAWAKDIKDGSSCVSTRCS
uniref:W2 domain-containing protein n=1 Tax=Grammatophora oceanica TaxID=210454 RepID=A0A7S1UVI5_9STRA|mmetsp:Transcript_25740/g.37670  ORF Transcript_25740/g.37670 Transcript_25740/m.37670 type:complete len:336 (+) Transcript_25740:339-1346(+)